MEFVEKIYYYVRRYVFCKKISVDTAKQMILDSKKKFNEIVIKCPGAIRSNIGKNAR